MIVNHHRYWWIKADGSDDNQPLGQRFFVNAQKSPEEDIQRNHEERTAWRFIRVIMAVIESLVFHCGGDKAVNNKTMIVHDRPSQCIPDIFITNSGVNFCKTNEEQIERQEYFDLYVITAQQSTSTHIRFSPVASNVWQFGNNIRWIRTSTSTDTGSRKDFIKLIILCQIISTIYWHKMIINFVSFVFKLNITLTGEDPVIRAVDLKSVLFP